MREKPDSVKVDVQMGGTICARREMGCYCFRQNLTELDLASRFVKYHWQKYRPPV